MRMKFRLSTKRMTVAELHERLERVHLSGPDLARITGLNPRTVRYWLNDQNPIPPWLDSWLEMYERLMKTTS